jgi:HEAT repeat protein
MRGIIAVVLALVLAATAFAQVTVEGSSSLRQLTGGDRLVTVVLKDSNAEDPNLRVLEIGPDGISVRSQNGQRHYYLFSDIERVRVQAGRVEVASVEPMGQVGLLPEQQQVVRRAVERAYEVFQDPEADQELKMETAGVVALAGEVAQQEEAMEWLEERHQSNDVGTAISAGYQLFLTGHEELVDTNLLEEGLQSGNRTVRARTARLAGQMNFERGADQLYDMMRDRRPQLSAPAVIALGRLGDPGMVQGALGMLTERSTERSDAAAQALIELGASSDPLRSRLREMLETAEGISRFRIARVLYAIDSEFGRSVMLNEMMQVPTLRERAAIVLAEDGNMEAVRLLRDELAQRFDPTKENLLMRAEMAAALIAGGDRTAIPILQEVLRNDRYPDVQKRVIELIAELNIRNLTTILQPVIESADASVAVKASQAAAATAYPQYHDRLVEKWS